MNAVWLRYVTGLRRSWRAWVVLSVVCGVALALPLVAAADARRTSTALTRHLAKYHAPDAAVAIDQSRFPPELVTDLLERVDRLPQVLAASRVQGVFLEVIDDQGGFVPAFDLGSAVGKLVDDRAIHEVGAFDLIEGRFPLDDRADEVMVNPEAAKAGGWKVGDVVESIQLFRPADFDEDGNVDPTKGEQLRVTIVGIAQRPDELVDDTEVRAPQVYLFPAFGLEHGDVGYYMIDYVRLRNGPAQEEAFQRDAAAISAGAAGQPLQYSSFSDAVRHADQAARPFVVVIWLLAAVLFTAAMVFALQVVVRALEHHYDDVDALRAIGASRREITLSIAMHAATMAGAAAAVAVVAAYASTAWTPFGAYGDIEPDPGLRLDGLVTVLGATAVIVMISVAMVWWGWRRSGREVRTGIDTAGRQLATHGRVSMGPIGRIRFGPLSGTAARFAFGRVSRTTGGSRTVIASAALGITLFTAALAFASSLDAVLDTPEAHGWNWDVALINTFGAIPDDALYSVTGIDAVGDWTPFTTGSLVIAGHRTSSLGLAPTGGVPLVLASGHAPRSADEIVVGEAVLDSIGRDVGDEVEVVTPLDTRSMTIVGTATFPAIGSSRFGSVSLGDGAATVASALPSADPSGTYNGVFVRVSSGGSRGAKVEEIRRAVFELGCTDPSCFLVDAQPPQLAGYDDLAAIQLPLSAALGCLVVLPLAYGTIATVRHRRRELAILRALGMTHRQLSAVLVLYAVVVVVSSAVLGLVLGVLVVSTGWRLFTGSVDIDWPVDVPATVALIPAGALVAGVALAMLTAATRRARLSVALH